MAKDKGYAFFMKRLSPLLASFILLVCAGRVSTWAASSAKAPHACCPNERNHSSKPLTLSDCCTQAVKPLKLQIQNADFYPTLPSLVHLATALLIIGMVLLDHTAPIRQIFVTSIASRAPPFLK
jgi:hypothetical protein